MYQRLHASTAPLLLALSALVLFTTAPQQVAAQEKPINCMAEDVKYQKEIALIARTFQSNSHTTSVVSGLLQRVEGTLKQIQELQTPCPVIHSRYDPIYRSALLTLSRRQQTLQSVPPQQP
uniref:Uncharacterized protein n=1 Tax=Magnetococcus massalia (strain MO-1) TaxID=451514 RepID=A0A1S7LFD0_MAGMO|nr:Exported protein of unknown function [Candidatus Magnetococcus massalia]